MEIDAATVISVLRDRPFTRQLDRSVRIDVNVWKCRYLLQLIREGLTFETIFHSAASAGEILSRTPEVIDVIRVELERVWD